MNALKTKVLRQRGVNGGVCRTETIWFSLIIFGGIFKAGGCRRGKQANVIFVTLYRFYRIFFPEKKKEINLPRLTEQCSSTKECLYNRKGAKVRPYQAPPFSFCKHRGCHKLGEKKD